jgi:hypothetical protein
MMINAVAVVQEFYRAMGAGDADEHIAALLSPVKLPRLSPNAN